MARPQAVVHEGHTIKVTCDDGLPWRLSLLDPDAGRQLRRLVGEVYSRDRQWAELIVDQLPPVWAEMYRRGWAA